MFFGKLQRKETSNNDFSNYGNIVNYTIYIDTIVTFEKLARDLVRVSQSIKYIFVNISTVNSGLMHNRLHLIINTYISFYISMCLLCLFKSRHISFVAIISTVLFVFHILVHIQTQTT